MGKFDFAKFKPSPGNVIDYAQQQPASAQEAHAKEVAWRNGWIANPGTTSYFWSAERNGVTFLQEYDDCNCDASAGFDPSAHLHKLSELPGSPKIVSVAVIHFCEGCGAAAPVGTLPALDGHEHAPEERPVVIPAFKPEGAFEPFTFVANPVSYDSQPLPSENLSFEISPGMAIIWGHRTYEEYRGDGSMFTADSLIVGRILADGEQEVHQVYSNGDRFKHASIDEAHAHNHPSMRP